MNWQLWIQGALAALIGGAATSISVIVVDPITFNLDTGWKKVLTVAMVSGVVSLAAYLKEHPVPTWTGPERRG